MSMDGTVLGDAIVTAFSGLGLPINGNTIIYQTTTPPVTVKVKDLWEAVGQAVVNHIKNNGVVTVTIPASTGGDGLQTDSLLQPTTHPATAKSISGGIA